MALEIKGMKRVFKMKKNSQDIIQTIRPTRVISMQNILVCLIHLVISTVTIHIMNLLSG